MGGVISVHVQTFSEFGIMHRRELYKEGPMNPTMELPWEDALLERKLESDKKDFLRTFVAFANSVRPGHTAIVLIGEKTMARCKAFLIQTKCRKRYVENAKEFILISFGVRRCTKKAVSTVSALK